MFKIHNNIHRLGKISISDIYRKQFNIKNTLGLEKLPYEKTSYSSNSKIYKIGQIVQLYI